MLGKGCLFVAAALLGAWISGCAGGGAGGSAGSPRGLEAGPGAGAKVTLLQTTDLHHHARGAGHAGAGPTTGGGYPRIAAYVEAVRATAGHPVLLVDSGDWSMGTLYDLTLGTAPLALWFADALRYDCITLGNHEFDYAPAGLAGILAAARLGFGFRTPIVASNLEPRGDPYLAPLVGPGKLIQPARVQVLPGGLKVGYLGLMGRDASNSAPAAAPVRFTDYARDYARVQGLVDDLRGRRGCGLVIALDHAGTRDGGAEGEDVDLARHVTGIDVIASGHTHNPLASARPVPNGTWTTLVCCAGANGTNVSRLDLAVRPGGGVALEASANVPMTDAGLGGLGISPPADPAFAFVLDAADAQMNRALGPALSRLPGFGDYLPQDPGRGIYHRVAECPHPMASNGIQELPAPGGLGDLCADALRAVPNALLAQAPPGSDPAPFAAAVVATGELRGTLEAGTPITLADLYGLLPLGISPDPAQASAGGEPLVSAYLDPDGVRELCAVQLLAQAGLTSPDNYLNLSGLDYRLDPAGSEAFFSVASAATAVALTGRRAAEGSAPAARAVAALGSLPGDQGAALRAALAEGNPYAGALVRLGDPDPDPARTAAHLALVGQVAAAAAGDAVKGTTALEALLLAKAMAALGPVSAFAPDDPACTGPAAPLGSQRIRVVLDFYALLTIDGAQARFGTHAPIYQSARGEVRLTGTTPGGLKAILANRVNLNPGGTFQELKTWMALALYLATPHARGGHFTDGRITAEYGSVPGPRQFPAAGAAVRSRNASYPADRIAALAALAASLQHAP